MKLKTILNHEKKGKVIRLVAIAIILLTAFLFYYKNLQADLYADALDTKYLNGYIILGLITLVFTLIATSFIDTTKVKKLHKQYFIIAIILGGCYLFVMPLFTQSDEQAHYLRAYELSEGYFTTPYYENSRQNSFDKSVIDSIYNNEKQAEYKKYEDMLKISKIQLNQGEKVNLKISAANYSIVNYIPHVLGILLGKLFHLNPYFCGIIGRFLSLLFCVSLVSVGIKLLPNGKFFALILMLSPTFLSYSASFSADGTTIAYSFLFISYILSKIKEKKSFKWQDYFLLFLLTICVSLAKVVYLPFVFLILLLPHECFKSKKQEIIVKIIYIAIGIFMNLGWQELLKWTATSEAAMASNTEAPNNWIMQQPIRYLMVVLNTIAQNGYNYLENIFAGEFLCHWQVRPFPIVNFGFIMVNLFAFLSEEKNRDNVWKKTIFIVGILGSIFVLICTALYLCTYEGARTIIGIQGRYFFPIICALLFFKVKNPIKINKYILAYITIVLNYIVMLEMITTFLY